MTLTAASSRAMARHVSMNAATPNGRVTARGEASIWSVRHSTMMALSAMAFAAVCLANLEQVLI